MSYQRIDCPLCHGEGCLESYAFKKGHPVSYKTISANGSFSITSKAITINEDLPPLQTLKTLIHEIAHALMHRDLTPTQETVPTAELEAESCAFLVCDSLGLDTSRYTFPYLAGHLSLKSSYLLLNVLVRLLILSSRCYASRSF